MNPINEDFMLTYSVPGLLRRLFSVGDEAISLVRGRSEPWLDELVSGAKNIYARALCLLPNSSLELGREEQA